VIFLLDDNTDCAGLNITVYNFLCINAYISGERIPGSKIADIGCAFNVHR
jgi:hypothetical protein